MEPAPKPRLPPKISSALADNEADGNSDYNDDFEKEDMVKVFEPVNAQKIAKKRKQQHYAERQTKESS